MRLRWVTVNDREVIRVAWQSWPDEIYYVKCSLPSTSDPLVCVCVCVCVCINTLHAAAWEFHPAPHMYEDTALSLSLTHTHTHTRTHTHRKSKLPKVFYERGLCCVTLFSTTLSGLSEHKPALMETSTPGTWRKELPPNLILQCFTDPCRVIILSLVPLQEHISGQLCTWSWPR